MLTPIELIVLFVVLYVIHKSFRQITLTGFAISFIIAVFASMYMSTYLHTQSLVALIIVIILFPPLQILIKKVFKSSKAPRQITSTWTEAQMTPRTPEDGAQYLPHVMDP